MLFQLSTILTITMVGFHALSHAMPILEANCRRSLWDEDKVAILKINHGYNCTPIAMGSGGIAQEPSVYVSDTKCEKIIIGANNSATIHFKTRESRVTLYTDTNCTNRGTPTPVRPLVDDPCKPVCMHSSDFGGEIWGSVRR